MKTQNFNNKKQWTRDERVYFGYITGLFSQSEMARALGLSRERIRQITQKWKKGLDKNAEKRYN